MYSYATYMGEIPEAAETYNVIGNTNEYGLIITESTFGGLSELACNKNTGKMDYGSLIWVTLQRAKTAREAIAKMDELVTLYGYGSTGESFSIADQDELWYMELIGKGRHATGAVWVARKVPDGFVTAHANQARITTFPLNDPDTVLYSSDVISFARSIGAYSGADEDFSFSDVYDPLDFSGARFCEVRVWSLFSGVMGADWSIQYLDYAMGRNLTVRMPLWVQPMQKLSLADVTQSMRNHFEGLALDQTGHVFPDVGAGSYGGPHRSTQLQWTTSSAPGKQFVNERVIAIPVSGWSIVCQSRPGVPKELAAVMWYGADDSSTSVHFPIYGSATAVPAGWGGLGPQDGVAPPLTQFDIKNPTAFWIFNLVANYAYTRWADIYPDVLSGENKCFMIVYIIYYHSLTYLLKSIAEILSKEASYRASLASTDAQALKLYAEQGPAAAVQLVTDFSVKLGDSLLDEWTAFFGQLFVKYRDGYVTKPSSAPVCDCATSSQAYSDAWYGRIAADTGDHYLVPKSGAAGMTRSQSAVISKFDLRSFN